MLLCPPSAPSIREQAWVLRYRCCMPHFVASALVWSNLPYLGDQPFFFPPISIHWHYTESALLCLVVLRLHCASGVAGSRPYGLHLPRPPEATVSSALAFYATKPLLTWSARPPVSVLVPPIPALSSPSFPSTRKGRNKRLCVVSACLYGCDAHLFHLLRSLHSLLAHALEAAMRLDAAEMASRRRSNRQRACPERRDRGAVCPVSVVRVCALLHGRRAETLVRGDNPADLRLCAVAILVWMP